MVCLPLRIKRPRRNLYCFTMSLCSPWKWRNETTELVADFSELTWIFMELPFYPVFSMADQVPSWGAKYWAFVTATGMSTGGAVLRISHDRVETPGGRERKCTIPGDQFSRIFLPPFDPFWMFAKRLATVITIKLDLICIFALCWIIVNYFHDWFAILYWVQKFKFCRQDSFRLMLWHVVSNCWGTSWWLWRFGGLWRMLTILCLGRSTTAAIAFND